MNGWSIERTNGVKEPVDSRKYIMQILVFCPSAFWALMNKTIANSNEVAHKRTQTLASYALSFFFLSFFFRGVEAKLKKI